MIYRPAYILLLFAAILSACGEGFKSAEPTPGAAAVPAGSSAPLPNKITGPNGELSWALQSSTAAAEEFAYEFKIPFGHVYKATSFVVKNLAPFTCQWIAGIENESPGSYNAGEVPCGRLVDAQWKQLFSIPVDPYYDVEDGFSVFVTGATVPVYLSRYARQGQYQESDLNARAVINKTSSTTFAQDISVRYTPTGTAARLEMCANIPGADVTAPNQIVNAKAWKKVLGQKISYDSNLTVTPGLARFDYGRGCAAADYGWSGQSLTPSLNFSVTKAPALSNANYSGLNVHINDWFLRMVDRIMGHFKLSFRKKLIQQAVTHANNIIDRDIESGEWFTKLHGPELVARTNERFNQQISRVMTRIGLPATTGELKSLLKDNCRVRKFAGGAAWTARLEVLCRDVVDQIELRVEPFAVDAASQNMGCYSHFANIHESSAWWGKACQFSARFAVKIPAQWKDYATEVRTLLAAHVGVDQIPAAWLQQIQALNLDSYTLMLLMEELDKQGFSQIVPGDWSQRIPAILQTLRARLAGA